ncbi:acyltransferase family protein [Arthrobacter sp. NPDC058288]|uniref:acyltransferase family protein n=1 Tax=Arthrobacter sp. NPDC058288 TaxID=3346424 RepID=UPI0036E9B4EF
MTGLFSCPYHVAAKLCSNRLQGQSLIHFGGKLQTNDVSQLRSSLTKGRIDALDGIRTLAVLAVFLFHAAHPAFVGGFIGVDVFFTLSGFVITLLLLKEHLLTGRIALGSFYANRAGRLWPALTLLCVIAAGPALLLSSNVFEGQEIDALRSVLHVMNLFRGGWFGPEVGGGVTGHTWSLAVEEQFYLVWPLMLIVLLKFCSLRVTTIVTLSLALLALAGRVLLEWSGASTERIYNGPDTRADQLLIGCALAMLFTALEPGSLSAKKVAKYSGMMVWPGAFALLTTALFVAYPWGDSGFEVFYRTTGAFVLAVLSAALFAGLAANPTHLLARILGSKALSIPGRKLSYGIYLWHYPVVLTVEKFLDGEDSFAMFARVAVSLAITLVAAWLSARFFEEPVRRAVRKRTSRHQHASDVRNSGTAEHLGDPSPAIK